MQLLGGPNGARTIIATYLANRLPTVFLPAMRVDLGLDQFRLPNPARYDAYDPYEQDVWPKVGSIITGSDGHGLGDWTTNTTAELSMSELYTPTYNMIIFAWARTPLLADDSWATPPRESALLLRDHLAAAVRMALLDDPGLGYTNDSVKLITERMREEYLEGVELSSGSRWAAGVQWFVPLRVSEALALAPYGVAETFITEIVPVGFDAQMAEG